MRSSHPAVLGADGLRVELDHGRHVELAEAEAEIAALVAAGHAPIDLAIWSLPPATGMVLLSVRAGDCPSPSLTRMGEACPAPRAGR